MLIDHQRSAGQSARGGQVAVDIEAVRLAKYFEEAEFAQVIALILTINSWNRIAVTTRMQPTLGG